MWGKRMIKFLKKLLALTLFILMVLGIMPIAFADNEDDYLAMMASAEEITASFTDLNFLVAVREVVGKPDPEPILKSDVEGITFLDVHNKNILSLEGIQYFIGLERLDCSWNDLTALNITDIATLTDLDVSYNRLSSLDVSRNIALESLFIGDNNLTSLDVRNNIALKTLLINENNLTVLDLRNNTDLRELSLINNRLITVLDVSSNTKLEGLQIQDNQLTSLDLRNNVALQHLYIWHCQLTTLDLSANIELDSLSLGGNQLTTLDLSANTALWHLTIGESNLAIFDARSYPNLNSLSVSNLQQAELDLSNSSALLSLQIWNYNQLSALDLSCIPNLQELYINETGVSTLDLSVNTELRSLYIGDNPLTTLSLLNNPALMRLSIWYSRLPILDLSRNTKLEFLFVFETLITSLDISNQPDIEDLLLKNNQLTTLKLSPIAQYKQIDVSDNNFVSVNAITGKTIIWDEENFIFYPQRNLINIVEAENFVKRLYQNVLGRDYDTAGLNHWVNQLASGVTGSEVAYSFVFSREFLNRNLSNSDFVDILYRTLMNRQADAAGRTAWVNRLNGGLPRENVFAGFINSPEFTDICAQYGIVRGDYTAPANGQERLAFVSRMYQLVLGRTPEQIGLHTWTNSLLTGTTGASIANSFIFSPEFINRNTSNAAFVDILYQTLMNRPADAAGRDRWVGQLNAGLPRENILAGFINSPEFTNLCVEYGIIRGTYTPPPGVAERAFITRLYRTTLEREPDQAGLNSWTNALLRGTTGASVANSFIFSPEMNRRNLSNDQFVEIMYNAMFGRASDAAGKNQWVSRLNNGMSRYDVFVGFVNSNEFDRICRDYGIVRGTAP